MGSYEGDRSFAPSSLLLDLGNRPPDFAAPFISGVEPLGGHHVLRTMGLIDDYSSLDCSSTRQETARDPREWKRKGGPLACGRRSKRGEGVIFRRFLLFREMWRESALEKPVTAFAYDSSTVSRGVL